MLEKWKKEKIGDFTSVTSGGTPSTLVKEYWNGNILWMNSGELNNKKIYDVKGRITELGYSNSSTHMIPKECVLIGLAGQGKTRGTAAINYVELCINQSIGAIFPSKKILSKYLYFYIDSKYKELRELSSGDGGRGGLNLKLLNNFEIEFPEKIEEQKAIADILTNIDDLIDSLKKTIEKKEKIFKSITQELLVGKNRIYEWKKVKLGNIGKFAGNGVDKKVKEKEQKIRLLNYMDIMRYNFIYSNVSNYFSTASNEKINTCSVKKGDIFLTPSSETRLDIGVSSVAMEDIDDLVYSYHIVRFRPVIEMDLLFRAYIFKNQKFLDQASTMCEGSGKRYVCSNKKFASFELEIPIDIREQRDIANKLYMMEKELNILKNKLQKYKKIKEGMMKDLLTGKVRLNYE